MTNPSQNTIGKYRVIGPPESGTQGMVYRAYDPDLDREVAVKVLHPHLATPEIVGRFRREAQMLASINHPNIAGITEIGEHNGSHYIVMEYVPHSVRELIDRGPLDIARAVSIAHQVALALEAARTSRRGVTHHDIKPDNLLMTALESDGIVKLIDFGIAHAADMASMTQAGSRWGTPYYMSPEQWRGERGDTRSDVYSLGIVMYQMLSGRVPFRSAAANSLAQQNDIALQHLEVEPVSPRSIRRDIPEELEAIVAKCMAKSPGDRYQTPGELAAALASIFGLTAPIASRTGSRPPVRMSGKRTPRPSPPTARSRLSLIAAGGFGAIIVIVLIVIVALGSGENDSSPASPSPLTPFPLILTPTTPTPISVPPLLLVLTPGGSTPTPTPVPPLLLVLTPGGSTPTPTPVPPLLSVLTPRASILTPTPVSPRDLFLTSVPTPTDTPAPTYTPTSTNTPVPLFTPLPAATAFPAPTLIPTLTPTVTLTPTPRPIPTPAPTPTYTPTLTPIPTQTPTPIPTPTPTQTPIPHIRESGDVFVYEGVGITYAFNWNLAVYGEGIASETYDSPVNIRFSDISHSDRQATITVWADDDSLVGDGRAEIQISNATGEMIYTLGVTVRDAGEATPTPSPTLTPTVTPTVTPTPTPAATLTPTPIPLPNLVLEQFYICVEGTWCWPVVEGADEFSDSRRVSITWMVTNRGSGPTQSATDLRIYADGEYHDGEYLIGRDADVFAIPALAPRQSIGQTELTRKSPTDFWPITFSLVGDNTIIAIVDLEDNVEENDNCGNMRGYRDRFAARDLDCDNVRYLDNLPFLPTPLPTPTPTLTPTPTPNP